MNKLILTSILLLAACKDTKPRCSGNLNSAQIALALEHGFYQNKVKLMYRDSVILDSILTTNESSNLAHDFIGLSIIKGDNNMLKIIVDSKELNYNLIDFICFKGLILSKKGDRISITPTNKALDYQ